MKTRILCLALLLATFASADVVRLDDRDRTIRQSVTAADGTTWLLVEVRPQGQILSTEAAHELLAVDAHGTVVSTLDAEAVRKSRALVRFSGLALLRNGIPALFGTTVEGQFVAVGLDPRSGRVVTATQLTRPRSQHHVGRVVAAPDGRFLVVGSRNGAPWILALNADLTQAWERELADRPTDMLIDAAGDADGTFAVLGIRDAGDSVALWLGAFAADGTLTATAAADGTGAALALQRSGVAVVSTVAKNEQRLRLFTRDLKPAADVEIAAEPGLPRMSLTALPGGRWAAAVPQASSLTIAAFDAGGAPLSQWAAPLESTLWQQVGAAAQAAVVDGAVVVPYDLGIADAASKTQRIVTRVARVAPGVK